MWRRIGGRADTYDALLESAQEQARTDASMKELLDQFNRWQPVIRRSGRALWAFEGWNLLVHSGLARGLRVRAAVGRALVELVCSVDLGARHRRRHWLLHGCLVEVWT